MYTIDTDIIKAKYSFISGILPTLAKNKMSTCLIKLWHHPHQNLHRHRHHRLLVFLQEGSKDKYGKKRKNKFNKVLPLIAVLHISHKCYQSIQFFALLILNSSAKCISYLKMMGNSLRDSGNVHLTNLRNITEIIHSLKV